MGAGSSSEWRHQRFSALSASVWLHPDTLCRIYCQTLTVYPLKCKSLAVNPASSVAAPLPGGAGAPEGVGEVLTGGCGEVRPTPHHNPSPRTPRVDSALHRIHNVRELPKIHRSETQHVHPSRLQNPINPDINVALPGTSVMPPVIENRDLG